MTTFALLPGAGSDAWYWHLVTPKLEDAGHEVVAVDLPVADESATFSDYADVVVDALGGRSDVVVVAQSLSGFVAPLVADRRPVELIVMVAAMTPKPGESGGEWWDAVGQDEAARALALAEGRDPDDEAPETVFLHDVPEALWDEGFDHVQEQAGGVFADPWPLDAWPDVPTRFLLCRHDRLFPADLQRRVVRERLGIEPDEMDAGHLPALARPDELADRLLAYVDQLGSAS
jgi:pimeloyl-ACP methyl ester carboxylesterase